MIVEYFKAVGGRLSPESLVTVENLGTVEDLVPVEDLV